MERKYESPTWTSTLTLARSIEISILEAKSFLTSRSKSTLLEQTANSLKVRLGSPTAFRLGGLLLTPKRQYPLLVSLSEQSPSSLKLDLVSDEGWYAVKLQVVDSAFAQVFAKLAAEMQSHLSR